MFWGFRVQRRCGEKGLFEQGFGVCHTGATIRNPVYSIGVLKVLKTKGP